MSDLNEYIRHAERWGTEEIIETAAADLDVVDLARLAGRLRRIDSKWRLDRRRRDVLIVDLDQTGMPEKKIAAQIGVDVRTVRQVLDIENLASEPTFQSQKIEQNGRPPTDDLGSLILFDFVPVEADAQAA